jgi:hypothetical protein
VHSPGKVSATSPATRPAHGEDNRITDVGVDVMVDLDWLATPIGIDAGRWVSRAHCRTILVAAHTVASCHRLLDLVDLVESDDRIQTVFTVAPDVFNAGVAAHLERMGALVIPWRQAVHEKFDLALAASHGGLHELHAPVMLVAHGAGHARLVRPPAGTRAVPSPAVYGLDAPRLIRDGRVIPSALMLSHKSELDILARQCPEALPVAEIAGDPCYDRLARSLAMRRDYRRALQLGKGQKLVVVASTWGRFGLFGATPRLLPTLLAQLPPERFRVALLLHPAIMGAHGHRQVGAWVRPCLAAGMILADPADDWRAYVAAADYLIGDHGSVTTYGAATGLPVLRAVGTLPGHTSTESPQSLVLGGARRLDLAAPMLTQVTGARPLDRRRVAAAMTSRPGLSDRLLRRAMYRLIGIPERHSSWDAAPVPGAARTAS